MEKRDNRFLKGLLTGVLCSLIVVAAATWGLYSMLEARDREDAAKSEEIGLNYREIDEKLSLLKGKIDQSFLFDVDEDAMTEGIYKGYISSLGDPYTVYYTEEEYNKLLESSSGQYKGIGVQISQNIKTNLITVTRVFRGSGAEEAGIQPGDILYKVDGVDITQEDINNVVSSIRGGDGTTVNIEVYRESAADYVSMDVIRREVSMDTVEWKMLDGGIGYIQITEFDGVTYDQFSQALEELSGQGMKGLVLDLRNNPGGLLDSVIEIADDLLPAGTIVSTKDKNGEGSTFESDADMKYDGPIAVLVNGNSASASEVLTGAIKDFQKGTIVGTTTYGKGIVQNIVALGDGTAMKMTVSNYYSPNGTNIHKVGIEPDVVIEAEKGENDNQLDKAVEIIKGKMQ